MEMLILWLLFGIVCAMISTSKGRSGCGWFLLGVLIGPFAIVVAVLPSKIPPQPIQVVTTDPPASDNPLDAIERLAKLRDSGAISESDYLTRERRANLMSRL